MLAAIGMAACQDAPAKSADTTQIKPPTTGSISYDPNRNLLVLVTSGPWQLDGLLQTWSWDGHRWARKTPTTSPPSRGYGLLAYDEARHVTVLQGGLARSGPLNDTWEWDGSTWQQRQSAHKPDLHQEPGSMAYDPVAHRVLLYQWAPRQDANPVQTWSWNGKDWTMLKTAHLPSFFIGGMVFDGQRLVLIGNSPDGNRLEIWGWTGSDWNLLAARHASISSFTPAAFDAEKRKVVLYGGGPGDDTWTWDGSTWARQHPKHSPPVDVRQLVYDTVLKRVLTIGGLSDPDAIKGIYGWDGSDWSALGADNAPVVAAGNGLMSSTDAAALIRRTVTQTSPILLPSLPAGVNEAQVTVDSAGFSLRAMNDDRSIEVGLGIVVPGNSNLGAASKTIAFRHSSADYQYIASDPRGWRSLWWIERPGVYPVPALKDQTGVPYALWATSMTEDEFFAMANTLR
jgi:hypothetical protein